MHVIHVVESFSAGVHDFIRYLVNNLVDNHHTIVYGRGTVDEASFSPGTEFVKWDYVQREIMPAKDLKALVSLIGILRELKNVEIIHLHSSKAGFLGRLACRLLGISDRVIYTPHAAAFLRKDVSTLKVALFSFLEQVGYKLGGTVVACSSSEAMEFRKRHMKVGAINIGIPITNVAPNMSLKDAASEIIVTTSGRISAQKNPKLFNSIASAMQGESNVRFVWIGDGEERATLSSPNIVVTGWVEHAQVFEYLVNADIYLSTSLWEGLSASVLQAMLAGLPLVLSSCTGNVDLIIGNNGYLYKEKNEAVALLKRLFEDKDLCLKLGDEANKVVKEHFALSKMVAEYCELYRRYSRQV